MPRNSSGTYTLPAGNPVAPNTLIETNWANPTLGDIASSITDSLDRLGRGTMLAPLKLFDGTVFAPALSFNSEATTGLFRPVAGALGVAVGGAEVARFTALGLNVLAGLFVTGATVFSGATSFSPGPVGIGPATGLTTLTAPLMVSANAAPFTGAIPVATRLHVVGADAQNTRVLIDAIGGSAIFQGRRANGTLAAPTAPLNNEQLASFGASGHDGTGWLTSFRGGVFVNSSENWTGPAQGASLTFMTTPNGSTVGAEGMRLTDAGNLGIGAAPTANTRLELFNATVPTHMRVRCGIATDYSCIFVGNDSATLGRALSLLYSGTAYVAQSLLQGPVGEQANVATLSAFPLVLGTNNTARLTIDGTTGNVGIGSLPQAAFRLDINGGGTTNTSMRSTSATGYTSLRWFNDVNRTMEINYAGTAYPTAMLALGPTGEVGSIATTAALPLVLGTANTARLTITPTGNLAFGCLSSPWAAPYLASILEFTRGVWIGSHEGVPAMATGVNSYYDGAHRYKANGRALLTSFNADAGSFDWYGSAVGVAGAPITLVSAMSYDVPTATFRLHGHITRFEFAAACPAAVGTYSRPHGGTRRPDLFNITLRCIISQGGWAVGDEVTMANIAGSVAYQYGANATHIWFQMPASGGPPAIYTSANSAITVTAANWNLIYHAIWL